MNKWGIDKLEMREKQQDESDKEMADSAVMNNGAIKKIALASGKLIVARPVKNIMFAATTHNPRSRCIFKKGVLSCR